MDRERKKIGEVIAPNLSAYHDDPQTESAALVVANRLKQQIDLLFKLVNRQSVCLKRTNRFRNYLKTIVAVNNIDTEKFNCEFAKYEQNYSLCWKRCRKLKRKLLGRRSSTKTTAIYDTLGDLLQSLTVSDTSPTNVVCEPELHCLTQNEITESTILSYQLCECKTFEHTAKGSLPILKKENVGKVTNLKVIKKSTNNDYSSKQTKRKQSTLRTRKKNETFNNLEEKAISSTPKDISKSQTRRSKTDKPATGSIRKRTNLNGKVKCEVEGCTYVAKLPYMLKPHMIAHSEERPFKCEVEGCQFRTKTALILSNHQVTHRTDRPFKCDLCGKSYKSDGLRRAHLRTHRTTRFRCEYEGCDADYKDQKAFRKHIKIVHTKEAPLLKCEWPECKYSTYRAEKFRDHRNVHTGERPYSCVWPDCDKSFKTQSGLFSHKLMHQNERRHKCRWSGCSYSCNLLGNLQKHEAIHERKQQKMEQQQQQQQ